MDKLYVIKIGGNIIEDEVKLNSFLKDFAAVEGLKLLVHGGGKLATQLAARLEIPQQMVDGRRITDAETLKVITMVYAGSVNKNIVAMLQRFHCNAIGLTGADGDLVRSKKRSNAAVEFGFVGDVETINEERLSSIILTGFSPVFAPLTHDGNGQLLNTNADTIAQELAKSLSKRFDVQLVFCFEKNGVLQNVEDESSVINFINEKTFDQLKKTGVIWEGMLPKLENALAAVKAGVGKVVIGKAEELSSLINGKAGTTIHNG
jgi:acetylglutamate kinase